MIAKHRALGLSGMLLVAMAWAIDAMPPPPAANAASAGITDASRAHRLGKRDIVCPAGDASASVLGGVLLEPGHEMNPAPDNLQPIVLSDNRGFVVAAGTTKFSGGLFKGGTDILLAGLDEDFSPRWATVYGGPLSDLPISVTPTRDGGYAVISHTTSLWFSTLFRWIAKGNQAGLLSKYGADGALEWVQYLAPGEAPGGYSVVVANDGGILVGGEAGRGDRFAGFLLKLSDRGVLQWSREIGRDHEDGISHLEVLRNGGVLASGSYRKERASPFAVWVGRLEDPGRVAWARSYQSAVGGTTGIAFPTADGGAVVIRSPEYQRTAPRSRIAVFAIDGEGAVRWSRILDFDERVTISNFAEPAPGRYLLFGGASASEELAGPLVLELDGSGQIVAGRAIDIASVVARKDLKVFSGDQPVSMVRDRRGGFVILGNLIGVPPDLVDRLRRARTASDYDSDMRSRIRMQVFLLRIGEAAPSGPCTRDVKVAVSEQPVEANVIELPLRELPANVLTPVPRINLDIRRLLP